MPDAGNWEQWEGRTVVGEDGTQVGRIAQVYLDHETGQPTWGSVHTGLVGAGQAFIPLGAGRWQGHAFQVPFSSRRCRTAPHFAEDHDLTHADQSRLYEHYGIGGDGQSTQGPQTQASPHTPTSPSSQVATEAEMTRSEEVARVRVENTRRESVRLRKTVVSEPVSRTVSVRREEVRVVREPITEAHLAVPEDGFQLGEEVHEVILMEEEPVLERTVVPVERVQLNKRISVEQRQVRGEIRREQIEVERKPHA